MTTASTDAPRLSESGQRGSALYLYTIVLIAAVGGFLFGYDLSLISGAVIFSEDGICAYAVLVGA